MTLEIVCASFLVVASLVAAYCGYLYGRAHPLARTAHERVMQNAEELSSLLAKMNIFVESQFGWTTDTITDFARTYSTTIRDAVHGARPELTDAELDVIVNRVEKDFTQRCAAMRLLQQPRADD